MGGVGKWGRWAGDAGVIVRVGMSYCDTVENSTSIGIDHTSLCGYRFVHAVSRELY